MILAITIHHRKTKYSNCPLPSHETGTRAIGRRKWRAMWRPKVLKGATALLVTAFGKPLPRSQQPAVAEEARALLEFLAPGEKHEVEFGPAKP